MSGLGKDMISNEEDSFASESISLTEEEKNAKRMQSAIGKNDSQQKG